jgi:hypothetical protein
MLLLHRSESASFAGYRAAAKPAATARGSSRTANRGAAGLLVQFQHDHDDHHLEPLTVRPTRESYGPARKRTAWAVRTGVAREKVDIAT